VPAVTTVDCDRDIEEHFRRSLGSDYCNYLGRSSGDNAVQLTATGAQRNGAAVSNLAAAAPSSGATVMSEDVVLCDSSCDVARKSSAISVTGA